jgi:protein O-mannosyl-transferase
MTPRTAGRISHWIGVSLIVALACGLYLPFLGNPLVFDDKFFFSGLRFAYYAMHPLGLDLRLPPYFSLASTYVFFAERIEAQRILSLAFHIACSLALYKLLYDLLRLVPQSTRSEPAPDAPPGAAIWAFVGAAVFAIHPVAVYGAAYLVQRSIVLATLFSLLSIVLFARGLARRSHGDAISAALMYALAVLCKEHSVLLPAVAVLAVPLVTAERRFAVRHAALYLGACVPVAIFVALLSKGLIGEAYEKDFGILAAQIGEGSGIEIADFPWSLSAVTQAGLFFKYLALWLWPNTGAMSVDLRVDFLATWSPGWIFLKVSAFAACGALGFLLLRRRGRAGLAGFGLLYVWILFLAEFSVARFQEPFVLYRSYLWAPGIVLAVVAVLSSLPRRAALAAFALACAVLLYQAHDRLMSFSSSLALWQDAVAKLPATPVPWGSRTLYNLGREYLYSEQPDKAIEITERCMALYPNTFQCYYARGVIHLQLEEYERALPYLVRALEIQPKNAIAHHRLGLVMENLGRLGEAKAFYRRASELGYKGANYELIRLETPRGGLLPPKTTRTAPAAR